HCDLHAIDVAPVEHGLQERVGEADVQDVLDRLLAEVVVDAEDRLLREHLVQDRVELLRGREVAPEGLLHDHARVHRAAGLGQVFDDEREHAGRDRQVVERVLRLGELGLQPLEGGEVGIVAVDVAQERGQLRKRLRIEAPVLGHARPGPRDELVARPSRLGHAHHRNVEAPAADEALERGKDLLVGEVARGAEEHQRVGARPALPHFFSTWPPKPNRMADSTRFWKSAWPRESKRSYREAVRTWAGTASSMAALMVQRPSPESETRPAKPSSPGSWAKAAAVKSRSHEATTLPRRQTSVTSAMLKSYW